MRPRTKERIAPPWYSQAHLVLFLAAFVIVPVLAVTVADQPPSRTANANCSSCHTGSFYMRVTVTSVVAPETVEVGSTGTVDVQVDVSCSHKSSNYATFSISVSLSQQYARLTLPSPQSLSGQVPGGTSAPYTWSRTFSFTVTGKAEGSEVITASARMDPNHESPAVTDTSTAPTTVTLTEHPPVLTLPSIEPTTGNTMTDFTYKVKYSDAEGDVPAYLNLIVDGSFKSELSPMPGQGTDHMSGVMYGLSGVNLAQGAHTYGFVTSDGKSQVELPVGGFFDGPEVVRSNSPPVLSNMTVSPESGGPDDKYTFIVDYSDPDEDPPYAGVRISISGGPYSVMASYRSAPLSKRDGVYSNGERYFLEQTLGEGTYEFVLNASDGALFTEAGPIHGPVVSTAPVLIATIERPEDGAELIAGEPIWFNGTYASNKAPTDVMMTWRSNISGLIGTGPSIQATLVEGHHEVLLNVSSDSLGLWSESKVQILALSELPVITIQSYTPSSVVIMDEMEELTFRVTASLSSSGQIIYGWRFGGSMVSGTGPDHRLTSDYSSAGVHVLECLMSAPPALPTKVVWKITIRDVPAPILHDGNTTIDLGVFEQGDTVGLRLNVSDPLGRPLSVFWSVDGVDVDHLTGLETSLTLQSGKWSFFGKHTIKALVQNPDGTELELTFHYLVIGPDPLGTEGQGPPDLLLSEGVDGLVPDDKGLGTIKDHWPGYLIVVVCSLVAVIKLVTAFVGLVKGEGPRRPPIGKSEPIVLDRRVDKEGFEIWG